MMGESELVNGIAGDTVDFGGSVHLVDSIGLDQSSRGDLARAGLFSLGGGGKREGGASTQSKHAGDDSGVAHADADDVGTLIHALHKAHKGDVVGECLGGRDDLDEVRLEGRDALVDLVEILGCREIVMADDQRDPGVS